MSSRDPSLLSTVAVVDVAALTAGGDAGQTSLRQATASDLGGYLWGLGAAAIWSGWWTVTSSGVAGGLSAADLAAVRFGIAGLVLLPLAWRSRQAVTRVAPSLLLFMALGAGAPYALVAGTGVMLSSAGVGGAITVGMLPVFTLILSVLILRERANKRVVAGIGCILVGAACVAAGAWSAGGNRWGLLFFVVGALMWAGYTVSMRRAGLLPQTTASVVCVASLVFYVPVWGFTGGPERLLAAVPSDLLFQVLYQSLLSAIGALYCFGRAVERLGATRASVFAAIVPAFSMVIAVVLLGESPSTIEIIGSALLSIGAVAAARSRPPKG
ncbi:DMT family transporter [Mesorhizobium sp. M0435]|uniref:DMT family transporter n=1 Tax=unclassified Mesorhizobium TaxID=325217 RepID=UPI00333DA82B